MSHEQKQDASFNPLASGILFFTLWLTIQALSDLPGSHKSLSWLLFSLSLIVWASIPWGWLRRLLNTESASRIILPLVFELTIAGYIIGWLGILKEIRGAVSTLAIVVGFVWLTTYIMVAVARLTKPCLRAFICMVFVGAWGYYFSQEGIAGSWPLIIMIAAVSWASVKPDTFGGIPLV